MCLVAKKKVGITLCTPSMSDSEEYQKLATTIFTVNIPGMNGLRKSLERDLHDSQVSVF